MAALDRFSAPTRRWFDGSFDAPTAVQEQGWPVIADGGHALLLAPTGSGKTLAAFLWAIDRLMSQPPAEGDGVQVLYVSPMKALVYDVERNLRAPLVGVGRAAAGLGRDSRLPSVGVRTGDTSQSERRAMLKGPPDILVTTPESLYLLLGSRFREHLRGVRTVILDEVHAVAASKRGAHLALSLERLDALASMPPQRVGLSATVRPIEDVARFLGGPRDVAIVDASEPPRMDLQIVVPIEDMERPPQLPAAAPAGSLLADFGADGMGGAAFQQAPRTGIWPSLHPKLLELIRAHHSTILFVNSRGLCERLARRLNELAEEDLVRAHHGSVSHSQRKEIEEALKEGRLACIVATSSLELGIDMGAVDLVIQVESPPSVASGLQRVGRAGHQVGGVSVGRIFPKFRGDVLESAVVAKRMLRGAIESLEIPRNPLDVLAQQIVAMVSVQDWTLTDLEATVRQAHPYATLSRDLLVSVLDMLSGRYPSTDFADLRPRINWDRETNTLSARPGAKMISLVNGGTIPDRGLYGVHIAPDGPRIGELDEEMVHETRAGETFVLGASTWRVAEVQRDRVLVTPAPGELGKMPFWHGDGPGRPIELGRELGAFLREMRGVPQPDWEPWLAEQAPLDELAAKNLAAYVADQVEATGTLPTDRAITVERFRDEMGDWRICILTPFGDRVHAPWAAALQASLARDSGFEVQAMHRDDGIVLRLADPGDEQSGPPALDLLFPEPEDLDDLLIEQLIHGPLFAARFRENAARSLLLTRRKPGQRMPLWAQRLQAANLLAVARQYPDFPIVLETYRSCLQDVFDLPALKELLSAIRRREVRVDSVETPSASPFARSLVLALVGEAMYDYDVRLPERRAQALSLDRNLLRELLGQAELRDLFDAEIIEQVELELQALEPERHARSLDATHDLLRRLGDLSGDEVEARTEGEAKPWLVALESARRIGRIRVAGQERWVALEDAALYRDALGSPPPPGVPDAWLEPPADPLTQLLRRYARTHGPFPTGHAAARLGLLPAQIEPVLAGLEAAGKLDRGEFLPGGTEREWCDPDVLRRIRRRTLAKLRGEVAPVDGEVLARFQIGWQGLGIGRGGPLRLEEVLDQLEGLALPFSELESRILPARVPGFQPRMLDELGALGRIVWIGRGALGPGDGLVTLCRRDRVDLLPRVAEETELTELHEALLTYLAERGASFLAEMQVATGAPLPELEPALWDLVWAGRLTNDTFAPLRRLGTGKPKSSGRGGLRRRRGPGPVSAGGRWSRVDLLAPPAADTERAHAWAVMLLERYGVVTREAACAEGLPGGFSAIYRVLREMEEHGTIRRGHFVDGLGGAQFALPGAIDRLRGARNTDAVPNVRVLAATDPANPYGALLSWPARGEDNRTPRRTRGASVVLVDGVATLYVERGGKSLLTFPAAQEDRFLIPALESLGTLAQATRSRRLRVERVDGEAASASDLREPMLRAGFVADYRGLAIEVD